MEELRHESRYRDRFVRRTIGHALPRPEWWRVRIEELTEDMKAVRKGRLEIIARTPGDFPVYAVTYGPEPGPRRMVNWPSATGSPHPEVYSDNDPQAVMIVAGIHGEETEGICTVSNLISLLEKGVDHRGRENPHLLELCSRYRLILLPCVNMDGRAVAPDCLNSCTKDDYAPLHTFLKDGRQLKWPDLKEYFPMPMDQVEQLGTYYNSDGYNIMLDCAPGCIRTAEARALLQLADRERIDCMMNLHSATYNPHIVTPSFMNYPENLKTIFAIRRRWYGKEGISMEGMTDEPVNEQSDINIAVTLATGAPAFTVEYAALKPEPFDNKLECGYRVIEATLEHGLESRLASRRRIMGRE